MTSEAWVALGVGAVVIFLQTIGLIAAGVWMLGKTRDEIIEQVTDHKLETQEKVNRTVRDLDETFRAIRQKINEVELYIRDNYVQEKSFSAIVNQVMSDMKGIGERIENRLLRMENKLDRAKDDRDRERDSN